MFLFKTGLILSTISMVVLGMVGEGQAQKRSTSLISKEILRLCQQPAGCEVVLPTRSDLEAILNNPAVNLVIQDFATAISKGHITRDTTLLAAISPTSPALAASIPELASRLKQISRSGQISSDPKATLNILQNPPVGLREVATIGVGPDGRPTLVVSTRQSQSNDLMRAGLLFISDDAEAVQKLEAIEAAMREIDAQNQNPQAQQLVNPLDPSRLQEEPRSVEATPGVLTRVKQFFSDTFDRIVGNPVVVRPDRSDQSPDTISLSGPRISTQEVINSKRPPVIDPSDTQDTNLTNTFPTGSFIDPDPDKLQRGIGSIQIPVTESATANTPTGGRVTTPEEGTKINTGGIFQEVQSTLQSDLCDARGNCSPTPDK